MASTPPPNDAFLREVDEELRRDQVKSLWDRFGKLAIAAVVAGLAALGGYLWWQNDQLNKAGAAGQVLSASFDDAGTKGIAPVAPKVAPLAESPFDGVAAAARLTKAAAALEKGDTKAAGAAYAAIAADARLEKPYRDLALVRQVAAEFDTMKPEAVVAQLKPLAVPGNPWFGSAGELVGMAYAKMGRMDLATTTFAAIAKDETVPESIRTRVVQLSGGASVAATAPASAAKGNSGS
ncbi:MAG: tetratricopeptide repeat protein [Sphingomonadaceae bacterium]